MPINENAEKSEVGVLPHVMLVLTFVTGLIDAVSFIGLGDVFTAI